MFEIFKLQDLQIDDIMLRQNYYNAMFRGRVEEARGIYNNNPQLWGKALTADMLNQLLDSIYILEDNYRNNVTEYLGGLAGRFQILVDELIYMQVFSEDVQYSKNNFVSYNGKMYFCKVEPPIGTLPTDDTYWLYLGLQGEMGAPDLKVYYAGAWSDGTEYDTYDAVIYENEMYVARRSNVGVTPGTSDEDWLLAVHVIPSRVIVSETEPENLAPGGLWIEILAEGD